MSLLVVFMVADVDHIAGVVVVVNINVAVVVVVVAGVVGVAVVVVVVVVVFLFRVSSWIHINNRIRSFG